MSPVRPRSPAPNKILPAVHFSYNPAGQNHIAHPRRGTQVVRERSAKPLCVGSIPTRASSPFLQLLACLAVSLELSFRFDWASVGQNRQDLASGADKRRTRFSPLNLASLPAYLRASRRP